MLKLCLRILLAFVGPLIGHQALAQDASLKSVSNIPPIDAPTNGSMIFDDEFQVLDLSKYNTAYHWGARWLNDGEQQVYVDPLYTGGGNVPLGLNPFSIVGGKLQIQVTIPDAPTMPYLQGQKYASGILTTYSSFTQLYGYFEIRAKFPAGKGYWPAFWMIPKGTMSTPPEIDIVEVLGDQLTSLFVTSHWNEQGKAKSKGFNITVPDMSADFHRYGALWTDTYIAWYFDGKRVAYTTTPPDLHSPMYLLLNVAVGGKWPGLPSSTTVFPGSMLVAYIRAYAVR
jgi:beta-glucanase (GH16 family)